ncbi:MULTISPECIES: DUF4136 domain-containing protein [unclassified Undibacterium]|nr:MULTISPECIES: DUF4136 domain-containing protein [unclassified Undibacterium]MEB0216107.1 DUF4136 domain-containing protein [Undibacterium sp. 5I2]WPX42010.1 DUF4136 domain-containing protein [Undibacterium sp. CCC3.4]
MKRFIPAGVMLLTLFLSGCASTFTSQVSSFHEWPANAQNTTYILERAPAQENNPEYKFYENTLRQQLGLHGFSEAALGAKPNLKIGMQYASSLSEVQVMPLWQPSMYDPYWRMHFSHVYYYGPYGSYGPYFGLRQFAPRPLELSVNPYYLHQLDITMSEVDSERKLANIKVSSEQVSPHISEYMPYLIESALYGFPQKNGSTVTLELPLHKAEPAAASR